MNQCRTCQRTFKSSSRHLDCPRCREIKQKKKCPSCGKDIWANSQLCLNCHNKNNLPGWKGGKRCDKKGYVLIYAPNHPKSTKGRKYVGEHIFVMEKHLGRYLLPGENIHHKNGVRDDNRIENLELWVKPQPSGIRVKDAVAWAKEILKLYGE